MSIFYLLTHTLFILIPGIVCMLEGSPREYRGLTGFRATQLIRAQSKDHVYSCEERLVAKYWACCPIVKDFT